MPEISAAAREAGAWLHVDGAFGLWAAVSDNLKHLTAGAEFADSWATDAHKWLNVPYDCGLIMCAHPEPHRAAMNVSASYLVPSDAQRDPCEWVPELSRRGRGFTVYAVLKHLGRSGIRDMIERCCARARQMAELLRQHPGVEILNDVVLNQVTRSLQPVRRFHTDCDSASAAKWHLLARRYHLAQYGCHAGFGLELVNN